MKKTVRNILIAISVFVVLIYAAASLYDRYEFFLGKTIINYAEADDSFAEKLGIKLNGNDPLHQKLIENKDRITVFNNAFSEDAWSLKEDVFKKSRTINGIKAYTGVHEVKVGELHFVLITGLDNDIEKLHVIWQLDYDSLDFRNKSIPLTTYARFEQNLFQKDIKALFSYGDDLTTVYVEESYLGYRDMDKYPKFITPLSKAGTFAALKQIEIQNTYVPQVYQASKEEAVSLLRFSVSIDGEHKAFDCWSNQINWKNWTKYE